MTPLKGFVAFEDRHTGEALQKSLRPQSVGQYAAVGGALKDTGVNMRGTT